MRQYIYETVNSIGKVSLTRDLRVFSHVLATRHFIVEAYMFSSVLFDLLLALMALLMGYNLFLVGYGFFVYRPQAQTRRLQELVSWTKNRRNRTKTSPESLKQSNVCATILFALAAEGKKISDCHLPDEASSIPYKSARI